MRRRSALIAVSVALAVACAEEMTVDPPPPPPPDPMADLSVTKTDAADPVMVGDQIVYTITVTNGGPSEASEVRLTDAVPAGVTFISATTNQGNCSLASGTVRCDLGTLANGASVTVTVRVRADQAGTVSNTAAVTAAEGDPSSTNNSATEGTTVTAPMADLSVTKTDATDPVTVGDNIVYTITVANGGPDDATGVTVSDVLPAGVTFVSATASQGSCSQAAGTVTCALGDLANGATATVTLTVQANQAGVVDNAAAVTGNEMDPDGANNNGAQTTTVNALSADLSVTKADAQDPVTVGGNIVYTIMVTNNGPDDATGVTVTDVLPAGVTFVTANASQGSCSQAAGTVTCTLGNLANGATATVTLAVTANQAGMVNNTATAAGNENDPNGANDGGTEGTTVTALSTDLSVTKSDAVDPVTVGNNIVYTITVTNNGPDVATGVTMTDVLPAGVSFVSATPSQGSCSQAGGTVTCTFGGLANGANATVTLTVQANQAGVVNNTASAAGDQADPNGANDSGSEDTTVNPAPLGADLAVAKSDAVDPVTVGNNIVYTITVINNGPGPATGVTMTDVLPAGVTFVSATPSQGSCGLAAGTVTCALTSLANGAGATVTLTVTANAAGVVNNTATASANETDANGANDAGFESTTVNAAALSADLAVTKTDAVDPVTVGNNIVYTITVTNNGPDPATGVTVTDVLPAGVTYVSAVPSQGTCSQAAGTVTCPLGAIANAANATVTLTVTTTAAGVVNNTASAAGNEADPNGANDSGMESTTVNAAIVALTISSGDNHSCGLTTAGVAYCWGINGVGQLGDGTNTPSNSPVAVSGGLTFQTVSAGRGPGGGHSCGVTTAGAAYCWGLGLQGQLGNAANSSSNVPVAVSGGLTFQSVSAGFGFSCGLTTAGAGHCWGANGSGQLGDGNLGTASNVPVAVVGGLTFQSVSARGHACGLTTAGAGHCWGAGLKGQLGDNLATTSDVPVAVSGGLTFQSVTAGMTHSCGVTTAGVGYCWGDNTSGKIGDGTMTQRNAPVTIMGGLTLQSLDAGFLNNSCGITTAGAGYCWGDNTDGQIGDGTNTQSSVPVAVVGGLTFQVLSSGDVLSCGVTTAGTGHCWGLGTSGELGNGASVTSNVPVRVSPPF